MRRIIIVLLLAGCTKTKPSPIAELVKNRPAAVFVVLAADCPLSQSYTLTMNNLQAQFKDVAFYGVLVGGRNFDSAYKIDFPVVNDPGLKISDFLGATKTPEAFAVDSRGETFYRGAIDNWAPELGQHRSVITEHYLIDALNSFLQHKEIQVRRTEAVGCFIEKVPG